MPICFSWTQLKYVCKKGWKLGGWLKAKLKKKITPKPQLTQLLTLSSSLVVLHLFIHGYIKKNKKKNIISMPDMKNVKTIATSSRIKFSGLRLTFKLNIWYFVIYAALLQIWCGQKWHTYWGKHFQPKNLSCKKPSKFCKSEVCIRIHLFSNQSSWVIELGF